jgi:hypothetical protein
MQHGITKQGAHGQAAQERQNIRIDAFIEAGQYKNTEQS